MRDRHRRGRVQAAAHAYFQNDRVGLAFGKMQASGGQHGLEERRFECLRPDRGEHALHRSGEVPPGNALAAHLDALFHPLEVGGDEQPGAQAGRTQDGCAETGHRALTLGAGDL